MWNEKASCHDVQRKGKRSTHRVQAKAWRYLQAGHCDRQARVLREVTQWHRLGRIPMKQILGLKLLCRKFTEGVFLGLILRKGKGTWAWCWAWWHSTMIPELRRSGRRNRNSRLSWLHRRCEVSLGYAKPWQKKRERERTRFNKWRSWT